MNQPLGDFDYSSSEVVVNNSLWLSRAGNQQYAVPMTLTYDNVSFTKNWNITINIPEVLLLVGGAITKYYLSSVSNCQRASRVCAGYTVEWFYLMQNAGYFPSITPTGVKTNNTNNHKAYVDGPTVVSLPDIIPVNNSNSSSTNPNSLPGRKGVGLISGGTIRIAVVSDPLLGLKKFQLTHKDDKQVLESWSSDIVIIFSDQESADAWLLETGNTLDLNVYDYNNNYNRDCNVLSYTKDRLEQGETLILPAGDYLLYGGDFIREFETVSNGEEKTYNIEQYNNQGKLDFTYSYVEDNTELGKSTSTSEIVSDTNQNTNQYTIDEEDVIHYIDIVDDNNHLA